MLNILQVVAAATPGPDGERGVNGPELRALNGLPHFERDFRITIAYPRSGRLWQEFAKLGNELVEFDVAGKFDFAAIPRLQAILRRCRAHIIHTQGSPAIDLFAARSAAATSTRLVVTRPVMIDDLPVDKATRAIYRLVDRYTLDKADAVVAVSKTGFESLARQGVDSRRLRLIHNGVDLRRFAPQARMSRERFGFEDSALVIGACAQLTPVKAWEDFLIAVRLLRESLPGVRGLIVGDGPLRTRLLEKRHQLGLDGAVRFTGHLSDVRPALASMDVYLFLSRVEGLSVALIEALAAGLPCVVTDVAGAREQVVDGENGYLVAPGDVKRAVNNVRHLLQNSAVRSAMGTASRVRAQLFDVRRMICGYQKTYAAVAEGIPS